MFVRCKKRFKDGKEHRYWSVVENVRVRGGRVVQRQVLYLGEINDSQRAAWCRSIKVMEGKSRSRQMALFPEDREAPALNCEVVKINVAEVALHEPRQWGACWLGELQGQSNSRDQLMLKLGAAKKEAGRAWNLVDIRVPETDKELAANGFSFHLRRDRLRRVRRREGRYLLRSNMVAEDPATLWRLYMQLIEIEQAFKELKHDLAIRPIFHQREERIEAHIFVSFIAYCLLVTLKNLARPRASGLTPRAIIEAFATIQMVDVHLPTTDGRHLVLPRHTRPNKEHELLLHQLGMALPQQPAPRICA